MSQVVDASIAVAWCAVSQATPETRAVLIAVVADGALVPSSFWFEVLHALARLEQQGRLQESDIDAFMKDAADLEFEVDPARGTGEMN